MKITEINGGIVAPSGFKAAGVHCGLRKNRSRLDLAMIYSDVRCAAAGVFTTNKGFAAPVGVDRDHLSDGYAQAIIINSGNANTCSEDGYEKAGAMIACASEVLGIPEKDVLISSTGVIGVPLPIKPILEGIPMLKEKLSSEPSGSEDAAVAIMTTDTKKKEYAIKYQFGGKDIKIGGICKGSGMIQPNMATMLAYITTDATISPELLRKTLKHCADLTFNMVSVDGDTSTNDTLIVMASGLSGAAVINEENEAYEAFLEALLNVCMKMAKYIAADGEGATKLIECKITGAKTEQDAKILAKSVIRSPLVKCAMFGADANWGRVLCALGYSGADFDVDAVCCSFRSTAGEIEVCRNGVGCGFDEDIAKEILIRNIITIDCKVGDGAYEATAWGCDLSYEYVRINGDYRS